MAALLNDGQARRALSIERLHAPHLVDVEVAHVLRRQAADGSLPAGTAEQALEVWMRLQMTRHPVTALLPRMWQLRQNLSAYDSAYVALAETLDVGLLTLDARLGRAPGARCPVTILVD